MSANNREGLVIRIAVRDEHGRVVGEVDAVSLKGLLSLAHEEELRSIRTRIVELPKGENGRRAVVRATVRTRRGVFTATGDADPSNVNTEVAAHIIRVAESRAIARALRFAVNIGEVAIEELGTIALQHRTSAKPSRGEDTTVQRSTPAEPVVDRADRTPEHPERFRGRDDRPTEVAEGDRRAMSSEQKKLLYRLAFQLGETRESSTARVLAALGVERLEWATRVMASKAIDALKAEVSQRRSNGHSNGAEHHG
jgi:hypothetical protein